MPLHIWPTQIPDTSKPGPARSVSTTSCYGPQTNPNVMAGGWGPGRKPRAAARAPPGGHARPLRRPRGTEQHPADAVGGGVQERVSRAAQRRGLPGVGHRHVRGGPAWTEACHSAALPPVNLSPPVEDRPAHQRRAKIPRRSCLDG